MARREIRKTGFFYKGNGGSYCSVWAPGKEKVVLHILSEATQQIEMAADEFGYWFAEVKNVAPGTPYGFSIDGSSLIADPASLSQPMGVHDLSAVSDQGYSTWTDYEWKGIALMEGRSHTICENIPKLEMFTGQDLVITLTMTLPKSKCAIMVE